MSKSTHEQRKRQQKQTAQALPSVPGASNDVSSERPPARSAEDSSRDEQHQGAEPVPSGHSTHLPSHIATTASDPALYTGAGSQSNATANVRTSITRSRHPNPSEEESFHPELSMVVWVNGRWCELACPDPSCKADAPVNKKKFFISTSALRDHVTRSHNGTANLSLQDPVERHNFLQSCVQRIFDDAEVQRLSEGMDPFSGPIDKRTKREADRVKETQARHGDHNQSTPTLSGGEVDASSAIWYNSVIQPQNSMNTVSGQSKPIDGRTTGDVPILSYGDRSGEPIIVSSWEDFDAYMAASKGSNLATSYNDQSKPRITLRSWDDLDAYMAAFKGSNITDSRSTLSSNRASQTAPLISRMTARHEEDPQNLLPIGPGLSATARLEETPAQTLTGIIDEHNGTSSLPVDVNRFRDSRGARVQNLEDGDSQRSGDEAEETLENEVK